jgi:hypothetical protein
MPASVSPIGGRTAEAQPTPELPVLADRKKLQWDFAKVSAASRNCAVSSGLSTTGSLRGSRISAMRSGCAPHGRDAVEEPRGFGWRWLLLRFRSRRSGQQDAAAVAVVANFGVMSRERSKGRSIRMLPMPVCRSNAIAGARRARQSLVGCTLAEQLQKLQSCRRRDVAVKRRCHLVAGRPSLVSISVRRIKLAMTSAYPYAHDWRLAAIRLQRASPS